MKLRFLLVLLMFLSPIAAFGHCWYEEHHHSIYRVCNTVRHEPWVCHHHNYCLTSKHYHKHRVKIIRKIEK